MNLTDIPGIGPVLAEKLKSILNGRDINDCHEEPEINELLPEIAKLYFVYKPVTGVPRSVLEPFVKKITRLGAIVAGSYRRGKDKCNDLDILIKKGSEKKILKFFVDPVISGDEIIRTFCKVKNLYIYCDIFSYTDLAPYLLYATGSKNFNLIMRSVAKKKGYLLNQKGLFKDGEKVENLNSEEDYFKFLDMKYLEPWERNK